jgi:signal transduction histidine kinase/ActR/RegA family two-component response regulator
MEAYKATHPSSLIQLHALEAYDDMVIAYSQTNEILYINPFAISFFNIKDAVVGKSIKDVLPKIYTASLNMGNTLPLEKRVLYEHSTGKHNLSLRVKAIDTEEFKGNILYINNLDDISKLEKELEILKEKTEDVIKSKSMFLANMSHELRTPLNAIIGMSELLIDTNLEPTQKDLIHSINQSASVLYDIINTILDFSKLEANQMGLESVSVEIPKLLSEIENIFSHQASVKKIGLSFIVPNQMPIVIGDPIRLRQILVNIIGNAIKFTHIGSVTVSVSVKNINNKTVNLEFKIEDTGIGFPMEVKEKIFNPFVQEDASITRNFGGTGLGLPICKSLVKIHNGSIDVTSVVGKGSTFIITIPYQIAEGNTSLTNKKVLVQKDVTARILVAEDNLTNQKLLSMQLRNLNYEVNIVENGQQAVEEYFENDYDIIIMDCQMPIMDGFCATLIIRQQEELFNRHIPIVALTASALKEDKDKCIECGMDDYITKPVKIETLHKTLQHWLSEASKLKS